MSNTDSMESGSHISNANQPTASSSSTGSLPFNVEEMQRGSVGLSPSDLSRLMSDPSLTAFLYGRMPSLLNQLEMAHLQHRQRVDQEQRLRSEERINQHRHQIGQHSSALAGGRSPSPVMTEDDAFRLCLARIESGKPCQPNCQMYPMEHYHCRSDGCVLSFKYIQFISQLIANCI